MKFGFKWVKKNILGSYFDILSIQENDEKSNTKKVKYFDFKVKW